MICIGPDRDVKVCPSCRFGAPDFLIYEDSFVHCLQCHTNLAMMNAATVAVTMGTLDSVRMGSRLHGRQQ
eukprot:12413848-Karenia_brevis.AAC.1